MYANSLKIFVLGNLVIWNERGNFNVRQCVNNKLSELRTKGHVHYLINQEQSNTVLSRRAHNI